MKIGILGAGQVGGNLGRRWAEEGHQIIFGVRDPHKPSVETLVSQFADGVWARSVEEAMAESEIVVLAIPWTAVENILMDCGDLLKDKIVIDATNRLTEAPANTTGSAGEDIARLIPGSKVVKAFNTIGAEQFLDPLFDGVPASLFICGDDPTAKATVAELARLIGFEIVDCGDITNSKMLEDLTRLWIWLAYNGDAGRNIAFKLLKR